MPSEWKNGPGEIEKTFTPVRSAGPTPVKSPFGVCVAKFHRAQRGKRGKNEGRCFTYSQIHQPQIKEGFHKRKPGHSYQIPHKQSRRQ
jgi:hypothetical protein